MADVDSISKYRIVGRLGQGGMATVYLALTQGPAGFTKLQVVKLLHGSLAGDSEFVKMFQHEARLAALLNHPNVVQTNEVGFEKGRCFIVMEYVEGQSLAVVLNGCQRSNTLLPVTYHLRVLAEVLAGLHYAHELTDLEGRSLGLVHRDVSPHNVMIGYDGGVKLLDFGIAKATATAPDTRTDIMKGKVRYMAPEQVTKEVLDRRADIFQVGIMVYQAVTGKPYWPKNLEHMGVVSRLYSGDLPDLNQVDPPMDEDLAAICRRALARSPEERFATAEEFRLEIEAAINRRDASATPRKVGEFVASLFADQRARIKKEVEASLRDSQTTSVALDQIASIPPEAMPELATGSAARSASFVGAQGTTSDPGSRASSATSLQRGTVTSSVSRGLDDHKPDHRILIGGIAGGIALVLAGIAILPGLLRDPQPTTAASVSQEGSSPSQTGSLPQAPDKIEVRISVEPSSAILYLDGAPLPGNPYTGRVDNDNKPHRIRATASGYQMREVETTWTQSPNVSLTLEREERKAGVPAGTAVVPARSTKTTTTATTAVAPPKIRDER